MTLYYTYLQNRKYQNKHPCSALVCATESAFPRTLKVRRVRNKSGNFVRGYFDRIFVIYFVIFKLKVFA